MRREGRTGQEADYPLRWPETTAYMLAKVMVPLQTGLLEERLLSDTNVGVDLTLGVFYHRRNWQKVLEAPTSGSSLGVVIVSLAMDVAALP